MLRSISQQNIKKGIRFFGSIEPKYVNLSELELLTHRMKLKDKYKELDHIMNNKRIHEYEIESIMKSFRITHLEKFGNNKEYTTEWGINMFWTNALFCFCGGCLGIPHIMLAGFPISILVGYNTHLDSKNYIIKTMDDYSYLLSGVIKEKEMGKRLEE